MLKSLYPLEHTPTPVQATGRSPGEGQDLGLISLGFPQAWDQVSIQHLMNVYLNSG